MLKLRTLLNPHNGYHIIIILAVSSAYMEYYHTYINSHTDTQVELVLCKSNLVK